MYEVSTRRCARLNREVHWIGTIVSNLPTFDGLNPLETFLSDFEENVPIQQRLLAMDEDYKLVCVSMSPKILFHNEACTRLDEIWKKLEDLFSKHDEMRGHMLEVEMNLLDQGNFDNIEDLFMKFNSIILHLKGCGIDKSTQHNQ